MPKVFINKKQRMKNEIGGWVRGKLFTERKRYAELGEALDMSEQAISYKLKNNSFSYGDLLTIFQYLNVTDEEILQVMKL